MTTSIQEVLAGCRSCVHTAEMALSEARNALSQVEATLEVFDPNEGQLVRVLSALVALPGASAQRLARKAGFSVPAFHVCLARLVAAQRVRVDGDGCYSAACVVPVAAVYEGAVAGIAVGA